MKFLERFKPTRYEWITTYAEPRVTDNYHPDRYNKPLFEGFIEHGWEIVSITVLPPKSICEMCVAVAVMRRPRP